MFRRWLRFDEPISAVRCAGMLRCARIACGVRAACCAVACLVAGCQGNLAARHGGPLSDSQLGERLAALLAEGPPMYGSPTAEAAAPPAGQGSLGGSVRGLFGGETTGPSNDRDWVAEHEQLAYARLSGDQLQVENVRHAEFFSYRDCLVDYDNRTYDLSKLRTVDFVMIPFNESPALAHTMLSFGFDDGEYLGVSVEVRLEKGESYSPTLGLFGQFELIYVVADERDLIRVRTEYRDVDVLVYRTTATPGQARRLLVDVMRRVNQLHDAPEYYDTLSNNCTTNIVRHINTLAPGSIPSDYRILLPGFADQLAYDLGLIDNRRPFAEVRKRARINDLALRYKNDPQFSQRIRGERAWR
jgi:hypothetical protein